MVKSDKPNKLDGKDWEWRTTVFSKICTSCKYLDQDITKRTCKAYPDGIPPEIWVGKNNHLLPYTGDNGIQYSPITEIEQPK